MAGFTIFETTNSFPKSILMSVGVISTVILFKVAIIQKLATLPRLWVSFKLWLCPLYVFIVFNFIIFAVAASSAFRRQKDTTFHHVPSSARYFYYDSEMISNQLDQVQEESGWKPVKSNFPEKLCAYSSDRDEDVGGDSIDATWKAIVESKEKQTPQLMKKSQTWDSSAPPRPRLIRADHAEEEEEPVKKKSDRFHQTLSLRRKISMTSEELKSRAEAFIEMVNRSIRLQRQQSEQRFLQAIKYTV